MSKGSKELWQTAKWYGREMAGVDRLHAPLKWWQDIPHVTRPIYQAYTNLAKTRLGKPLVYGYNAATTPIYSPILKTTSPKLHAATKAVGAAAGAAVTADKFGLIEDKYRDKYWKPLVLTYVTNHILNKASPASLARPHIAKILSKSPKDGANFKPQTR